MSSPLPSALPSVPQHCWPQGDWGQSLFQLRGDDGPPHQILSYTLLFSLFLYFLYIADPPLCTTHRHDHTRTHFIGPVSLIWWTHVLQFTCSISILSIPNVCPPMVQPIMDPCTMWSGTYHSFALDEPYAHFLVYHLYLTCLYLPFTTYNCLYEFPPEFRLSTCTSHHITSHCLTVPPSLPVTPCLEMIPYPQITPSEPHRIYT